ncbi:MAG: zinc ribbon domain-containing protein [Anaerolineales bacterium]|nr:zinc ribbon domain-containing protein [Anaerolineales bacterium]
MKGVSAVPVPPETVKVLQSAGILSTLTNTRSTVVFSYSGLDFAFKTALYAPVQPGGIPAVSISETDQGLKIASPPLTGILLEMVLQYMGESQVCMVDVDITLSLRETAVLFAFLDAGRRALLKGLLEGSGLDQPPALDFSDVLYAGQFQDTNLQWFTPYFMEIAEEAPLQQTDIDRAVPVLEQKGLLSSKSGQLRPSPDLLRLMISFLLVESYSRIQAAQGTRVEDLQNMDIWAVQGRNHALLSWTMDESSVTLKGLSPAQWLLLLSDMLDKPEGIFEGAESAGGAANSAIPVADASRICPGCSSPIPDGKKFCTTCGYKF